MKTRSDRQMSSSQLAVPTTDNKVSDAGPSAVVAPSKLCDDVMAQIGCDGGTELLWRISQVNRSLQTRLNTPFAMRLALQADGYDSRRLPVANFPEQDRKLREMFHGERFFSARGRSLLQAPPVDTSWKTQYLAGHFTAVRMSYEQCGQAARQYIMTTTGGRVSEVEISQATHKLKRIDLFWAGQNKPTWRQIDVPCARASHADLSTDGRWMLHHSSPTDQTWVVHLFDLHGTVPGSVLAAKFTDKPAFTPDCKALVGYFLDQDNFNFIRIDLSGTNLQATQLQYPATRAQALASPYVTFSPERRWAIYGVENSFHIVDTTAYTQPLLKNFRFAESISHGSGGFTKGESRAVIIDEDGIGATIHDLCPPGPSRHISFPSFVIAPPLKFGDDKFLCQVEQEGVEGLRLFSVDGAALFSMVAGAQPLDELTVKISGSRAILNYTDEHTHQEQSARIEFSGDSPKSSLLPPDSLMSSDFSSFSDTYLLVEQKAQRSSSAETTSPPLYSLYAQDVGRRSDTLALTEFNKQPQESQFVHGFRRLLFSEDEGGVLVLPLPT